MKITAANTDLGRAIANGGDKGVTKHLFDDSAQADCHGEILGGGREGTDASNMIGEIVLTIEVDADAVDFGKTTGAGRKFLWRPDRAMHCCRNGEGFYAD